MAAADPADRLWWRSKEALDTAYALEAALQAAPGATFVIFLQDDVQLAAGFTQQLQTFIAKGFAGSAADVITLFTTTPGTVASSGPELLSNPWGTPFGAVALAFSRPVAQELVEYFRANFADVPVDWLLNTFIEERKKVLWAFQPNLVQHVGVTSSLAGKQQPAASLTFRDRTCWVEAPNSTD